MDRGAEGADQSTVIGVDGCPGGWIAVSWQPGAGGAGGSVAVVVVPNFAAVLALPGSSIAIDMPIGLPAHIGPDGRGCDKAARAVLGGRQSSVFAVPSRSAVMTADYGQACARAAVTSDPPRKVAKQCFNLFPKIREIDALMTPDLQARVRECHPEVAFWALNGDQPLTLPKKVKSRPHPPGLTLRQSLLTNAGFPIAAVLTEAPATRLAGPDDVLDAAACAWVAAAATRGTARCFPSRPAFDGRGLAMAIWTGPAVARR